MFPAELCKTETLGFLNPHCMKAKWLSGAYAADSRPARPGRCVAGHLFESRAASRRQVRPRSSNIICEMRPPRRPCKRLK